MRKILATKKSFPEKNQQAPNGIRKEPKRFGAIPKKKLTG
jgi:hypothetical protein